MSLLKLGSLDLGSCPACGRKLFPAAYVIRDGYRFHPECFRPQTSATRHERQREPPAAARASRTSRLPEPRPAPITP